jgi:hypothetical protein
LILIIVQYMNGSAITELCFRTSDIGTGMVFMLREYITTCFQTQTSVAADR